MAPTDIPAHHLGGWKGLINEVPFVVELHRGMVVELTMMPAEAFMPQPPHVLIDWQVKHALDESIAHAPPVDIGPAHA